MTPKLILALLFVALHGCATFVEYDKADYFDDARPEFDLDATTCEFEAQKNRKGSAPISYNRIFDSCMRTKGYVLR
jgi:hypothetical protein